MTNATKANVIALVNAALGLLIAFGVDLSDTQVASILTGVNAVLVLVVSLTYKDSKKRVPDGSPPTSG